MPDDELLKDVEKMLRIAKAAETSVMNFANGDEYVETSSKGEAELLLMKNAKKWMQIQSEDDSQSITTEKIISHKKFAASLENVKDFAVQKQPQLLRHVQHLETAFATTCYAEATPQATLERYLL
ncbi:hypothetical protein T12_528 [Trichinella patagoniensis]|uniref:Uncharacterized protein n=1 Tax=Trichinella patagoniensis TaxID=990121 RepID=A0A0V1AES0_9BILA|nr:hypothetical protein T12_528 [Trichinella patagoniensis]